MSIADPPSIIENLNNHKVCESGCSDEDLIDEMPREKMSKESAECWESTTQRMRERNARLNLINQHYLEVPATFQTTSAECSLVSEQSVSRQEDQNETTNPEPPRKKTKGPTAQDIQELQAAVLKREEQFLIKGEAVLEKLDKLLDKCLNNN